MATLAGTKVSAAGIDALHKALPRCRIEWDGGVADQSPADRKAAEYVLSIGGSVRINEHDRDIKIAADLPKELFQLTSVDLRDNKQVSNDGLSNFNGCKNLRHVDL